MRDTTNVFNIPANYHFFESLYFWLDKTFANDVSNIKVLLPNHRSCRELHKLYTQKNCKIILPKITAISDISYEDFFDFLPNEEVRKIIDELLQIKVLDAFDYLFFLAEEVQKQSVFGKINFNQALKISLHLKEFFDEIEYESAALDKLKDIDDCNLSRHRQITLDFLKNFYVQLKNSLLKKNIFFAASYQNFIISKFSQSLNQFGSRTPLVIAGSTGSISFSRNLIKSVAKQKNGFVILRGLWDEAGDSEIKENHPQFFLDQLVNFLNLKKNSIKKIVPEQFMLNPQARQDALSLLMLPHDQTIKWQSFSQKTAADLFRKDCAQNFQLAEAKNEVEEAKIISLILSNQKGTSALIVNNNNLAELVKLELKRLNLVFNDSRNLNIFDSKLINFLILILDLKERDFDPHTLLALLKHPLCRYSENGKILTKFEIEIVRQASLKHGLTGIEENLKGKKDLTEFFEEFIHKIESSLIKTAENLSNKNWDELLEREPAQKEIFEFFRKLELKNYVPDSVETFKVLLAQIHFFERADSLAPIQILSTIEARLLNFDCVIISSLNEGDFPKILPENWLGKKIRKDLGIDNVRKKIGQSAYDFCNYSSSKSLVLTRSKTRDNAALIESPFLLKLKTFCQKAGINFQGKQLTDRKTEPFLKADYKIAEPKPKKELRPTKISITEISKLITDPYFIYAKKILQLRELKKIDFEPGYAEFGSFVHEALEVFIRETQNAEFNGFGFKEIFKKYFPSNESELIWWPKFEKIFSGFLEKNLQIHAKKNMTEIPVEMQLGGILINGKIDRIILDDKNNAEIFDYKTGLLPSTKDVISGIEPQLTIAALMLAETLLQDHKITSLNYWKLSSSIDGEIKKITKNDEEVEALIAAAKAGLEKLFQYFSDEKNGYLATTKNERSEYQHLSRIHAL